MFAPIAGTASVPGFDVQAHPELAVREKKISGSHANEVDRQTFAAMMDPAASASGVTPVHDLRGPTALSGLEKFANMQKLEMQDNFQSMRDFSAAAPYLSMSESTLFGMELSMKMTVASTQFKVASGVGKSTGKGIDTLMRNQ